MKRIVTGNHRRGTVHSAAFKPGVPLRKPGDPKPDGILKKFSKTRLAKWLGIASVVVLTGGGMAVVVDQITQAKGNIEHTYDNAATQNLLDNR